MKLRNKIFLLNALTILLVITLTGLITVELVYDYNLNTLYRHLLNQSRISQKYIVDFVENKREPEQALADNIRFLEDALARQVGFDVIISNSQDGLRPEQEEALQGNTAYYVDTAVDESIFYVAFPIIHNGSVIGSVSYKYSLYEVDSIRRNLTVIFTTIFLIMLPIVFAVSYGFSFRMIRPLEKLKDATLQFSKGDFSDFNVGKTGDEIDELSGSFMKMGHEIKAVIDSLKEEQAKQKRFHDSLTHEIRTPLTNIIGYSDLSTKIEDFTEKEKCNEYIRTEGERLLRMVDHLLVLSKLKQYDLAIEKRTKDLSALIEKVLEIMALRLKRYNFSVATELEQVLANVDADKIRQVIINVLDNAIKHSDGDKIEIKLWQDSFVTIQVSDNGKGIDSQDLGQITEPFFRAEKSRSRKLGGAGLGLTICQQIVEKHGGRLAIKSEPGNGTVVTITLHP
jgi:signal transduction histidine kinase